MHCIFISLNFVQRMEWHMFQTGFDKKLTQSESQHRSFPNDFGGQ